MCSSRRFGVICYTEIYDKDSSGTSSPSTLDPLPIEMNEIVPLPLEMFETCGGAYLKISIGKGNMTIDDLIYMVNRYRSFFE